VSFHLALAAGTPPEMGLGNDILGIAPLAGDCSPQDNVISFSFANAHPQNDSVGCEATNSCNRTNNLCWTVAQESAHAFGLDHQYEFIDGRSACNDPMTYRSDCGGQKFFRNESSKCGEFESRNCRCGALQNSHIKISAVFGPGTPITGKPTSDITLPATNGGPMPATVIASSFSQRGVEHVELILNGHKWAEERGAPFGGNGQPETAYGLQVPGGIPMGNYDIIVRAYDDLGAFTDSEVRTALKGAPCTSAATCLNGQKCEGGKCFWDPPSGAVGDECTFSEFCLSNLCAGTADQQICTQPCVQGPNDTCPEGFACVATNPNGTGVCFFPVEDTGCCSASNGSPTRVIAHAGLGALLIGLVVRRRRRK
jgi:MYXO-CTERM domain-containing protein